MKATYEELELIISQQRNQLSQLNKQIEQQDKLIKQLLSRISDLENRINKNSKNSSKPPSSDQKPSHKVKKKKENRPYQEFRTFKNYAVDKIIFIPFAIPFLIISQSC